MKRVRISTPCDGPVQRAEHLYLHKDLDENPKRLQVKSDELSEAGY